MTETRPIDTEIDDLRAIAELLDKHEWRAQQRMLNWLWEKFFSGEMKRRETPASASKYSAQIGPQHER